MKFIEEQGLLIVSVSSEVQSFANSPFSVVIPLISKVRNEELDLTLKEFELLHTLLSNPDAALSAETLLERVWREEPEAQADTVWLYVSYLRGKLRAVGSAAVIEGDRNGPYRLVWPEGGRNERT